VTLWVAMVRKWGDGITGPQWEPLTAVRPNYDRAIVESAFKRYKEKRRRRGSYRIAAFVQQELFAFAK